MVWGSCVGVWESRPAHVASAARPHTSNLRSRPSGFPRRRRGTARVNPTHSRPTRRSTVDAAAAWRPLPALATPDDDDADADGSDSEAEAESVPLALRALREVFGHAGFRPGQEWAVRRALAGKSSLLVQARTKSPQNELCLYAIHCTARCAGRLTFKKHLFRGDARRRRPSSARSCATRTRRRWRSSPARCPSRH